MTQQEIINNLNEMQEYITNIFNDCKVAIKYSHDTDFNGSLYGLADAAKDVICMTGYMMTEAKNY